jgi:ABC-type phosphate transport system substrate-binding protein
MRKLSTEPVFGSFEEGTRFVFTNYMDSSLTKQYKQVKKEK